LLQFAGFLTLTTSWQFLRIGHCESQEYYRMIQLKPGMQLTEIIWDLSVTELSEKDAFYYYEQRWRYVQKDLLSKDEEQLIAQLIVDYGNGVFLPR
jgi:hypothetical protein